MNAEVMSIGTYSNAQSMARYLRRVAPIVAADPLSHLERQLQGVRIKQRLALRSENDPADSDQFDGGYQDLSGGF